MPKSTKKRTLPQLQFYRAPHLSQSSNLDVSGTADRTYSQMSLDAAGNRRVLNSTVTIDVDQSHAMSNSEDDMQVNEDNDINYMDDAGATSVEPTSVDEFPPLDPAYVQHCESTGKKRRVRESGDESLKHFVRFIDVILAQLIALDGRGQSPMDTCQGCHTGVAEFQCLQCYTNHLLCCDCIVSGHRSLYFHRIQKWNGSFFIKTSLKDLGLRIQLGHAHDDFCLNPNSCPNDDFLIIHTNGLHEVGLDFCGCGESDQLHINQLLQSKLYPATMIAPKTAATMATLDLYDILSYESKMSAFEFYYSLERLTDNTGMLQPRDRYPSFIRMAREWRHLLMLKRAGRGHDSTGATGTKEGECAVLCPACPQPDINMAPDWKLRPEHLRYLDALFISLDACFRLKRRNISSDSADPGLSHGYSYFVEERKFKSHLERYKDDVEPKSTCSRHDAVNLSESRHGKGHAATGVGAVVCSRHDMKRSKGVAQLQKGERYCNMDYIFYLTTQIKELYNIVVSYDIVCQWHKNLMDRLTVIDPACYLLNSQVKFRFLVPKFHLPAHVSKCRTSFSFNFTKDVGRTDGEAPERGWAPANKLAPSTREMGPGHCRDTLDSHFGDENHKKVIGLGHSLLKKITDASTHMAEFVVAHQQLESTLHDQPNTLKEWTDEIVAWENDPSNPNPFEREVKGATRASVLRQMAEDERQQLERGHDFSLDTNVTPSVLISTGIDLESEQRAFKVLKSKIWNHSLDRQHTQLLYKGNSIIRKIEAWSKYQLLYIPSVSRLRAMASKNFDPSIEVAAHEIPLWLPSHIRRDVPVSTELYDIEFNLRIPQALEALDNLRTQLQVRAHVFKFKERFVRGQGANTRARNSLNSIQARVDAAAEEYRVAYSALDRLSPILGRTDWRNDLRKLLPEDIRDISEGQRNDTLGTKHISWIWTVQAVHGAEFNELNSSNMRDSVRIEWAKSRAQANRFTEEVSLLSEEMIRVLRFFAWKAQDWTSKSSGRTGFVAKSKIHAEGVSAYALKQAQMYKDLSSHFQSLWVGVPIHVARMQAIIRNPSLARPGEFDSIAPTTKPSHCT